MKKFIALSAVCALFATACSKDQNVPVQAGKVSFEITASADTRAGVYSEQVNLQVTNVNVYAFKNDGSDNYLYAKTFTIPAWTAGQVSSTYTVPDADELAAGSYKFLAVGRNSAADGYTLSTLTAATKFEDMAATVGTLGDEQDIYSGNMAAEVTEAGTRVVITMKRAVSGVLGYFTNVPEMIGTATVRYLRLSMNTANTGVNLVSGLGQTASTSLPYNIIDIDLEGQAVTNGVYSGNAIAGVTKLDNTQLGGSFVIPAEGVTFTLGLYDAGGAALKTWTVQNAGSGSVSLVANNLYSLGKKATTGGTDGGTPGDPSDDDAPIDLMVDQDLSLTISPDWEPVNYLTIQ